MKIEVFESSCCKLSDIYALVEQALNESGVDAEATKTSDMMEAIKRGIMRAPAVVIDGKVVCVGRVPEYEEVARWISRGKS